MYSLIWIGLIAFSIFMYVVLDGFSLGLGILSIFLKEESHRDIIMSSILPIWDGNETWLVFGGASLYGAFPLAFSMLLPMFYIPILILVCALLLRGIAFEFRMKATKKMVSLWNFSFFIGSLLATLMQGMMLGTFVIGFSSLSNDAIKTYVWLNPFGVCCAIALVFGYILLGANWLILKTERRLQQIAFHVSRLALIIIAVFIGLISFWSPIISKQIADRWFNPQLIFYLACLPIITAVVILWHWHALKKHHEYQPFFLSVIIFMCCFLGFMISTWPYLVPRVITISEAAAPDSSLKFMLIGVCVMLPILVYTIVHAYYFFRGKVKSILEY